MNKSIKLKKVQVCVRYANGGQVYTTEVGVKWKDFKKVGISRAIDASTGKPFLRMVLDHSELNVPTEYGIDQ